jgi:hypothetical protein
LANNSTTLRRGAESWPFSSTGNAMEFASNLVKVETKLTVYDEDGVVLLVASVYPR